MLLTILNKIQSKEFDVNKIDLTKLFKDYLDNKFKELKRLKERDERLKSLKHCPIINLQLNSQKLKNSMIKGLITTMK